MTESELAGMERDCNVIRPHEVRRLVAEVRLVKDELQAEIRAHAAHHEQENAVSADLEARRMADDDLAEMVVCAEQWQNEHQMTLWECAKDVGSQTAMDLCRARSNGDDMAADTIRLVAEVRRLRALLPAPGTGRGTSSGSAAMTEELSRMTGERFATSARAALPGTTTA